MSTPIQTYFVPLREDDIAADFSAIDGRDLTDDYIRSIISITVAAPGTIIWFDHWEDGYEVDITAPTQTSTSIWGDADISNDDPLTIGGIDGLPMGAFSGGESIILENSISLPRNPQVFEFDGGDRILVSYPVAVTRAAYPSTTDGAGGNPGSLLAGAVEVFATDSFGTNFVIPVGEDTTTSGYTDAFSLTSAHIMAGQPNTEVFLNGSSQGTITNAGGTLVLQVDEGDTVTTDKAVQVDLVTGDDPSSFEMRWYALAPREEWSNDYVAPFAEEAGSTGFWFYNPNEDSITINYDRDGATNQGNFTVAAMSSLFIEVDDSADIDLPNGIDNRSGLRFFSEGGEDFYALAQIDADDSGRSYDWGHPLVATDKLTSQALIGLGYGNTTNNENVPSYSKVYVTAVEAATLRVDYNGDGTIDETIDVRPYQLLTLTDDNDEDMSGALVYATKQDDDQIGVDIAVAWGQEPGTVQNGNTSAQSNSLDMGTVTPPLPELTASKSVSIFDDQGVAGKVDPGDTLEWTITVLNFGRVQVGVNGYNILDDTGFALSDVFAISDYVAETTRYTYNDGADFVDLADAVSGTPFPLDGNGFNNTDPISGRIGAAAGETQTLTFKTKVKDFEDLPAGTDSITNVGVLRVEDSSKEIIQFDAGLPLEFQASVDIEKATNGEQSDTGPGENVAPGSAITWTYEVTIPSTAPNTTHLFDIVVTDDDASVTPMAVDADNDGFNDGDLDEDNILEAGETWLYEATGVATLGQYTNIGSVTGTPVYANGTPVTGVDKPTDQDASNYFGVTPAIPSLSIDKVVVSVNGGDPDGVITAAEQIIVYDIIVKNTGQVTLTNVTVKDPLTGTDANIGTLAPDESFTVKDQTYETTQNDIDNNGGDGTDDGDGDIDNVATADSDQTAPVTDEEEVPIDTDPSLSIDKVVVSVNGGDPDGVITAAEQIIVYDIIVKNTGQVTLTNVTVKDPLTGTDVNIGTLAPDESFTVKDQTYETTQNDIDNNGGDGTDDGDGDIDNIATADSDQTAPVTDEEEVPIQGTPDLEIEKSTNGFDADTDETAAVIAAGETVTWTYVVTNTGTASIDAADITVIDDVEGEITTIVDQGDGDATLAPGEVWTYEKSGTAQNLVTVIDWEEDLDGNALTPGTIITDQFQAAGLTVSATQFGAMIFDSSNPTGGDDDLATANLKNIVIISEDGDASDPDDNEFGGIITLDWENPVRFESTLVLDIEEAGSTITTFDENGAVIDAKVIPTVGDGQLERVDFGDEFVSRIEYSFIGSGATIPEFEITDVYRNTATVYLGNDAFDSDNSGYINPEALDEDGGIDVSIFNTTTDQLVTVLEDGDVFSTGDLPGDKLTISAEIEPGSDLDGQVGSMRLRLTGEGYNFVRVESVEPYALFGDNGGDFFGGISLGEGDYALTLDSFSGKGAKGALLDTQFLSFSVTDTPNLPPEIDPLMAEVSEDDGVVVINLLEGASDPEGSTVTLGAVQSVEASDGRTVNTTVNGAGVMQIDPDQFGDLKVGEMVTVTVNYTITDGARSVGNTATLKVNGANDAPIAVDDDFAGQQGQAITVDVLSNDIDVDGDVLEIDAVTDFPDNGALDTIDGKLVYTSNATFMGTDSFTYKIKDENGVVSNEATVTIDVSEIRLPPNAVDDKFMVLESDADGDVDGNVLVNDINSNPIVVETVDGQPELVGEWINLAGGGQIKVSANGDVDFDADGDFDTLSEGAIALSSVGIEIGYADGVGDTTASMITIEVTGENSDPLAMDDTVTDLPAPTVLIDVLDNDTETDSDDSLTIVSVDDGTFGETSIVGGEVLYELNDGAPLVFPGDMFSYTVADRFGAQSTANVMIAPEKTEPKRIEFSQMVSFDGEQNKTGGFDTTQGGRDNDLEIGKGDRTGLVFEDVAIRSGATIEAASLVFTSQRNQSGDAQIEIRLFDGADAIASGGSGVLTDPAFDAFQFVAFDVTDPWAKGEILETPDLSTLIQQLIDTDPQVDGTYDLSFALSAQSGIRRIEAEEFGETLSAQLNINYSDTGFDI